MMDFDRFSLDTLLKMARDVNLIESYEKHERFAHIVVRRHKHVVSHSTARSFVQDMLTEWWNQQMQLEQQSGERQDYT